MAKTLTPAERAHFHAVGQAMSNGPEPDLWTLVHEVERAAWSRSWSQLRAARKALEARIGPRPSFPAFNTPKKDVDNSDGGR